MDAIALLHAATPRDGSVDENVLTRRCCVRAQALHDVPSAHDAHHSEEQSLTAASAATEDSCSHLLENTFAQRPARGLLELEPDEPTFDRIPGAEGTYSSPTTRKRKSISFRGAEVDRERSAISRM